MNGVCLDLPVAIAARPSCVGQALDFLSGGVLQDYVMRGLGHGRLESSVPERPVRTIQHLFLFHSLLETAHGDAPSNCLQVGLRHGCVHRFSRRRLHGQADKNLLVGTGRPLVENGAANLQLLDVSPLISVFLAKGMLGIAVHGNVLPGAQEYSDGVGLQFPVAQRDHLEQPLGLRTIIRIVILSRKDLDTNVLREVSQLHRIISQFVPSFGGWIEVVVEERVTVAVVCPCPGEENAFLVFPGVDIVGLVTVLDLVGHPDPLLRKTFFRQSKFEHFIGHREVGNEHLLG